PNSAARTMPSDTDDFPPPDGPILSWGDPLPLLWNELENGTVSVQVTSLTSRHGTSLCCWRHHHVLRSLRAYAAYNVPYPDGSSGIALFESNMQGMLPLLREPVWRRRKKDGRSWWPGQLTIRKESLEFRDADSLLPLPTLSDRWLDEMRRTEVGQGQL